MGCQITSLIILREIKLILERPPPCSEKFHNKVTELKIFGMRSGFLDYLQCWKGRVTHNCLCDNFRDWLRNSCRQQSYDSFISVSCCLFMSQSAQWWCTLYLFPKVGPEPKKALSRFAFSKKIEKFKIRIDGRCPPAKQWKIMQLWQPRKSQRNAILLLNFVRLWIVLYLFVNINFLFCCYVWVCIVIHWNYVLCVFFAEVK